MKDVDIAVEELLLALDEYGSDITLRSVTLGAYNPMTGSSTTVVDYTDKAFINKLASESIQGQVRSNEAYNGYEMALTVCTTHALDTSWKVVFKSVEYKVLLVVPYTLQNTIFKYEILVKR